MEIKKIEYQNFSYMFNLAKYASAKIDQKEGRVIVIKVLENWDMVCKESKEIWVNLIERAGFYPYLSNLENEKLSLQGSLRRNWFKSDNLEDVYFHVKQKDIETALIKNENIVVSAPTSFGKSLIIEEVIASKKYDNLLIIQPTLALIDETRRKLKKYSDYNIVVNSKQEINDKNIFILTAERVLEIKDFPKINFLVVDEFYKISNRINDERINVLNIAISRILYMNPQILFLTPNIDGISKLFLEKYKVLFLNTEFSLVTNKIKNIKYKNSKDKKNKLFDTLYSLKTPSLVYVQSAKMAYNLAHEYMDYLKSKESKPICGNEIPLIGWIENTISRKWEMKDILSYRIGIHNGDFPRHMTINQLEYFEKELLDVLFVTTSLIEGVNTSAKNVLIYSKKKGNNNLDYFDYQNIKGRAGRMGKHYTGRIYNFETPPEKEEFILDVPFIDQEKVSDEVLLNLKDNDINKENKKRVQEIKKNLPSELVDIFKDNAFSIKKQKELYYYLLENISGYENDLFWENSIPTYDELRKTLFVVYKNLENSNKSEKYINSLSVKCLKIINDVPLSQIIRNEYDYYKKTKKYKNEITCLDNAILHIFRFLKRESGYKIPKYLMILQSILNYISKTKKYSNVDYTYFSTLLESEKVNENLMFLIDYGIPTSTLKKIQKNISIELKRKEEIIERIQKIVKSHNNDLTKYEEILLNKI
ncbi:DEAD/DEAH box helicase [Staphylococcus hominis]|uniref:DEAD/DEAH box helicase n=1 Tax=Staphylococcus hominis TaxID=1290 RepID=UPI0021B2A1DD|nr:DEAD/DEAH box helicase [Staphylococcus hominis]